MKDSERADKHGAEWDNEDFDDDSSGSSVRDCLCCSWRSVNEPGIASCCRRRDHCFGELKDSVESMDHFLMSVSAHVALAGSVLIL